MLDNVHILKFFEWTSVNGCIVDGYFSDHDAVKFIFTERNNVYSNLMEEMFVQEILAKDIFMISQTYKILEIFSDRNQSQK